MERLQTLPRDVLTGLRRGIEKESLRVRPDGALALTPHPARSGSALTHPHITTDFSESQLELITGVHASAEACLDELTRDPPVRLPRARRRAAVGGRACPAACRADDDDPDRPLRHVQRRPRQERLPHGPWPPLRPAHADDLGHPLQLVAARRVDNDEYFALIRNFRRHSLAAAVSVRRLAGGVLDLRRRPRARAAAADAATRCTCRTAPRCAWAASATRATRSRRSR